MQVYNFENGHTGNYYDDVIFNLPEEEAFALTDAKIYMQLRTGAGKPIVEEFSTENEKITVVTSYQFKINGHTIAIDPGRYVYDILIVFADEIPETCVGGKWIILPTITQLPTP